MRRERGDTRPLAERVRAVRRRGVSYLSTSGLLLVINAATEHGRIGWCLFPIGFMAFNLMRQVGGLWADGVAVDQIFTGEALLIPASPPSSASALTGAGTSPQGATLPPVTAPAPLVASLPRTGPHAVTLRQAQQDLGHVHDLVARLSDTERKIVPDVAATARSLYARIVALAAALERLDEQIGTNRVPALDERITQIEQSSGDTGDRDRRLTLLRRQRDMVAELVRSRATLHEQFESAGLLLQNLALDVLKIRSSGLDSALGGITSVTQEARALSREIGYVLSAADELRDLNG